MYKDFKEFVKSLCDEDYTKRILLDDIEFDFHFNTRCAHEKIFDRMQKLGWPTVVRADVFDDHIRDDDAKKMNIAERFGYYHIKHPTNVGGFWTFKSKVDGNTSKFSVYGKADKLIDIELVIKNIELMDHNFVKLTKLIVL